MWKDLWGDRVAEGVCGDMQLKGHARGQEIGASQLEGKKYELLRMCTALAWYGRDIGVVTEHWQGRLCTVAAEPYRYPWPATCADMTT